MNVLQPKAHCQECIRPVFERIDERNMAVYTGVDEGETMSALHIVDADGHIREEVGEIQEYPDPPFAGRNFFFPLWPGDGRFRGARIHSTPPKLWQDYMDAVGSRRLCSIQPSVYPMELIQEAVWACALARAYNTWLHDRFMKAHPRPQGVAILPIQDPQGACEIIRKGMTFN